MRVERLTDWGAVGEATWNGLVARSATPLPFSTWQFQTAWWRLLGEGRLHLLGVQDAAADWVAMLPLYDAGSTPASLRLVGGVDVADYLDLIAVAGHEEAAWKALLGVLPAGGAVLDLRPVPAASPTVTLLPGLAAAAGRGCRIERDERCPVIDLPASWEAFLATLSGKDRHELRRKLRRADDAGARVEVARTPAGIAAFMDSFLDLHRKSKVGKAPLHGRPHGRVLPGSRDGTGRRRLGRAVGPVGRGAAGCDALLPGVRRDGGPLQLRLRSRGARPVARGGAHRPHHRGRHPAGLPSLRLPARRRAVQVRLRGGAHGCLPGDGRREPRRAALASTPARWPRSAARRRAG